MGASVWAAGAATVLLTAGLTVSAVHAQPAPLPFTFISGGGGGDQGETAGFMALGELRREGDIVTVPSLVVPDKTSDNEPRYVIATTRFNCTARTGQIISARFFDAAHGLMGEVQETQPSESFGTDSSVDLTAIRLVCGEARPTADNPAFSTAAEAVAWADSRTGE